VSEAAEGSCCETKAGEDREAITAACVSASKEREGDNRDTVRARDDVEETVPAVAGSSGGAMDA
jgi:hypothetical protein